MTRQSATILKLVGAVWLGWLAVSTATDWLTAENRFHAKLDEALWKLRQPGVDRVPLSSGERARYQALLRSGDPASRWQAAADLAHWRDQASVPWLVDAMQDDAGTRRTCVIAQSLGAIGDSDAVPALLEAIYHPRNLDLRVCAAHALADIGDDRAVSPLIAKAENPELREDDRASAIRALGDLAEPEAAPVLGRIARDDPDRRFRTLAETGLRQIALAQADDPVEALAVALNSPAEKVPRAWIIQRLGDQWDSRAASALNRFVSRADSATDDRIQAAALLLHRGAVQADVTRKLAASGAKQDRWLARYVQAWETDRLGAETFARGEIIKNSTTTISAFSP